MLRIIETHDVKFEALKKCSVPSQEEMRELFVGIEDGQ